MKKIKTLWLILNSIFAIIFNALFFLLGGTKHNESVWISYAFIHFAILMLLLLPYLIREGKNNMMLGFSRHAMLYATSLIYFLLEFVTGLVFILVVPEDYTTALILQLCFAGLYVILLISYLLAETRTAEAEEIRQGEIAFVKMTSARINSLLERVTDKRAKRSVEMLYDAIYSSPVKSNPDLEQMESYITHSINDLDHAISKGDNEAIESLSKTLLNAVNDRNARLRLNF